MWILANMHKLERVNCKIATKISKLQAEIAKIAKIVLRKVRKVELKILQIFLFRTKLNNSN